MNNEFYSLYCILVMKMLATEDALCEHLPKMAAHSSNPKLREALTNHWEETKRQRTTLAKIAQQHSLSEEEALNDPFAMMLDETEEMVTVMKDPSVRDAFIVAAAQTVEHYEIAHYNTLISWSNTEYPDDNDKFSLILVEEEKSADILSSIATGGIFTEGLDQKAQVQT
ncbi:MAG: DUF892 family protein [Patescibacteria group bacterium]